MGQNGGPRPGSGRKSKAEELKLIERLTPMADKATEALRKGVEKGEYQFIKLFMEYFYGKPHETVKMTHELPEGQKFKIGDTTVEF